MLARMISKTNRYRMREIIIETDLIIHKFCENDLARTSDQKER